MRLMIRLLAALAFAAGLPALGQDLTIISKVTKDGKPAETTTSYLSRDYIRNAQGDGKESIYDLKAGQMTVLDGKKKTYYVITRQDIERALTRGPEENGGCHGWDVRFRCAKDGLEAQDRGLQLRELEDHHWPVLEDRRVPHQRAAVPGSGLGDVQGLRGK